MDAIALGKKLREMYQDAPKGDKVAMIHLFGIKYSNEIKASNIKEIIDEAGISSTYGTEVGKGVKLSHYVKVK